MLTSVYPESPRRGRFVVCGAAALALFSARAAGANLLWAPCFDARAKEQGAAHGVEPLIVLEEAGKLAGIAVATEVVHPADVDRAVAISRTVWPSK